MKWKTNQKIRNCRNSSKIQKKETQSIPLTLLHDLSLSYLGTETSIKSDEVKLELRLKSPLLQTYKIIHDRSLSYLGTETSIKSDEVKLDLRQISLLQTYKIIHDRSLSYLGTETSIKVTR